MFVRLVAAAALAAAVPACRGDGGTPDEELEGLVVSPPSEAPTIDLGRASKDGLELGRALALPHHLVGKALGAHTVKLTSRIEVKEGDQLVEQLADETLLEVADDGEYHARYNNSADYGREVIWRGGVLYLRPRYAKWHRRPPADEHEAAAILDQMYAIAGESFALLAHAAEVSDQGAATVAGREGRKVAIKLDPSPRKPRPEVLTQRKWRQTVTVQALSGDAVLDGDAGFPLQARFRGELGFVRDGRSFTMTVEVGHEISGIGQAVALAPPPPEETVDTPERSREVDERDALLQGMAPSAKKSGGSASVTIPEAQTPPASGKKPSPEAETKPK